MKRYILLILFIGVELFAQSIPNGYTSTYQFRKYAQKALPGADSLNADKDRIDAAITGVRDSMRLSYTYTNTLESEILDSLTGIISYVDSKTGASLVDLTSAQTITGAKVFSGGVTVNLIGSTPMSQTIASANETLLSPTAMSINLTASASDAGVIGMGATGISQGTIITIVNIGANAIDFYDSAGGGNLQLAGNFTMGVAGTLTLIYNTAMGSGKWIEISRSTNN